MSGFPQQVSRLLSASKQTPKNMAVRGGLLFAGVMAISVMTGVPTATAGLESVLECGDVTGKVFDDKNRNGYQDEGEAGLPGVRLATARGLLTITDKHGRYHVACARVPRKGIGSIFLMKLDAQTLPSGYRVTSENPRVARLTRGKATKLNFGASQSRVVRLDLAGAAFEPGSTGLKTQWHDGIDQLLDVLGEDHAVLRLIYQQGAEESALVDKRMRAVSRLVEKQWQQRDAGYDLEIERVTRVGR